MRTCVAIVVCLALSAGGLACGNEEEAPAEALTAYFDALAEEDWKSVCDLLSDKGTKGLWEAEGGCEGSISEYRPSGVAPATRKAMEDGDYVVEVTGDTATVTPEGTGAYSLVREDGEWLLLEPS